MRTDPIDPGASGPPSLGPSSASADELRQYRLMVENIREYAVFMLDAQGNVSRWNVGAERILGWLEEEILGQPAAVIFTPEDREAGAHLGEMEMARREGSAADERWHVRRDGSRFFAWGRMMEARDEAGNHAGFVKVLRDMTEERRAQLEREQALESSRRSVQQLYGLLRQAPGFICILRGPDHRFEFVNDAYVRLFGDRGAEGKTVREVFPELAGHRVFDLLDRVYATGERYVARQMKVRVRDWPEASGHERVLDFIYAPMRDESGVITGVFCIGHDLTEHAQREAAVQESEVQFRALAQASSEVLYRMSPDWSEMRQLSGGGFLSDTPAPNKRWLAEYIHPDDQPRVIEAIQEAIRTKGVFDLEHRVRRADGSLGWTHSRAVPVLDANGELVEWFGAATDVTARHEAQDALRDANRQKDEFLAMLAHELRNPLAPLTNALHLLKRSEALTERDRSALAMAERQRSQLARLVDDLLEISRISQGKIEVRPEALRLNAAVYAAVESVASLTEARRQQVAVSVPEQQVRIHADPVRIAQVLENLLTNASKYTPEGGSIRVEVEAHALDVEIRVIDNGVGIEPGKIGGLFQVFHQIDATLDRSQGGLGIGLALVKRLVELHGGTVQADSPGKGKGSTFTVRLPLQPPTEPHLAS